MNYSLYLTDACNLNCKYCYEKGTHRNTELSFENIKSIIDIEVASKTKLCVLTFFGGEPLLKKELIYKTADYIKAKKAKTRFMFNMTTNGTLVDDEFIEFFKSHDFISLSYSMDGQEQTQDKNRVNMAGKGLYDLVGSNAKKLLKVSNKVCAVPVVTKNNVSYMFDNVKHLLDIGFKIISLQFDFNANWDDNDLEIIKKEIKKVAQLYISKMREEDEFSILSIDEKIRSYIHDEIDVNNDCSVGMHGANVGTDGNIYPCMQFMYKDEYIIGNCQEGINNEKQKLVHDELKQEVELCKECSLRRRCNHTCSCINRAMTGDGKTVSPFTCELERLLIDTSDEIAEALYKEKNPVFIQKFYNSYYNRIEDEIRGE
jgi:uncharacterized protein